MAPNRSYFGLIDIHLDGEELCQEAALHAAAAVSRRRGLRGGGRGFLHTVEDRRVILAAYKQARERAAQALELPPAMESLVEELYVAEKAMASLREEEPGVWRGLPVMAQGEHLGLPRVYDIAVCLAGHRAGRVEEGALGKLLDAYQAVSPLMMRELCALPAMLKTALVKLIALECAASLETMRQYAQAEALAAQAGRRGGQGMGWEREDMAQKPHLAARLFGLLAERDEQAACARLSERLAQADQDVEALFSAAQRADVASAGRLQHALKSLRALDAMDWERLSERFSRVDAALRADEAYPRMDARSRAWYRQRVELLAARLGVAETVVARQAAALAQAHGEEGGRKAQAGYYLAQEGQRTLYAVLRPDKRCKLPNEGRSLARFLLLQGALLALLLLLCGLGGWHKALLALFPAWSVAALLSVRVILSRAKPGMIPRLDFEEGLPADCATLVVVPTLITDEAGLRAAVGRLEVHMLATRQPHCYYAVLGDFPDGREPRKSGEAELLRLAKRLTRELNEKYPAPEPLFYYLHRRRELNVADGLYMGRERKRGALCDLVKLMQTGRCASFSLVTDPLPPKLRYCLTLDADTVLPPLALAKLAGAMAHPLNAPVFNEQGLVCGGYGVIAPRMAALPRGAAKSPFAWVVSGDSGLDSYSPLCAEFYQDVFGTGIFGGKGIFDVSAFARAVTGWIPENTVLSHDLLEGCLLRAGLAEDVVLYDSEPAGFIAWWKRQHRWIRGDWQLLPFLRGGLKDAAGVARDNPLSGLSRYKIWDNLRRTLTLGGALACLLALPWLGWGWYAVLALIAILDGLALEAVLLPFRLLFSKRPVRPLGALWDRGRSAARAALDLLTLPYGAYRAADAHIRTLYRVLVSHRHMLEWQTAAQVKARPKSLSGYYRAMWHQAAAGLLMLAGAAWGQAPVASALLGLAWLATPLAVARLDHVHSRADLPQGDRALLMDIARRTWAFFDTFAGPGTGYLPPDNFQQAPSKPPVSNTSPTNIGMGLMACLCARDLGFITGEAMVERLAHMLDTMERMEKWQGHFYNWYRLDDLSILPPRYVSTVDSGNLAACLLTAAAALEELGSGDALAAAGRCRALLAAMDFRPLYDGARRLFHIGFDENAGQLSRSWYDLMASEARLTSLVAVALGQVKCGHWFSLSRLLVPAGGGRTLLSWSGTMFEYLMPVLFTGLTPGTLLYESCENALRTQMRYGEGQGFPWGVSESGYYAFDRAMYYQYRAFGVPRLGLMAQRELSRVVSPYSTLLALLVPGQEEKAVANLRALMDEGALGDYGMFEALDYTPGRVAKGKERELVQSYMAHHQGMGLCALANCLCEGSVSRRFLALPEIRAVEILLEEKQPAHSTVIREFESAVAPRKEAGKKQHRPRRVTGPRAVPETQLLSNGNYTLFLTDSGLGFSQCGDVMLTRWRPDPLRGDGGVHLLARVGEDAWELTDGAETILHPHKVEFNGRRGSLTTHMEACVSAQQDAEVRSVTLSNRGETELEVELGVFAEVCLAAQGEDAAHPAFVRVTVEAAQEGDVLLFHRRAGGGPKPEGVLYAQLYGAVKPRYLTDRLNAQGRGGTLAEAMRRPLPAGFSEAPVDPCVAARAALTLPAGQSATVWFLMGYAPCRAKALAQAEELRAGLGECMDLAWAHSQSALRMAGLSEGKAELFERIAARLLLHIPQKSPRPAQAAVGEGLRGLWRLGISGDFPILLMEVKSLQGLRMARTLLELYAYLAARKCTVDLVLVGCYPNAYRGELQTRLGELCSKFPGARLFHGYDLSAGDRQLLQDMAMVVADGSPGRSLDKQFAPEAAPSWPERAGEGEAHAYENPPLPPAPPLSFENGLGGLDPKSGEYIISLGRGETTPLPWCNLLANGSFGALLSETGGGYTFGANSREAKLTPWYNEPVRDQRGEILLLWDEETPWNPFTVEPGRLQGEQARVRHGYGYTTYEATAHGLLCQLTQFIHREGPVKYLLLSVQNPSLYTRRLNVLYGAEWVLGDLPHPESVHTYTKEGVAFAQSLRNPGLPPAYLACPGQEAEVCHDREALLRAGWAAETLPWEARAYGGAMSGLRVEAGVPAGGGVTLLFLLGQEAEEAALSRVRGASVASAQGELTRVKSLWRERLNAIEVHTPAPAFDALLNGRLLYQVYAARLFARSGYYQCGGAVGFRDQLQDMLALLQTDPGRVRAHLLLCAARQFPAGDVLHWWHMPFKGVRTRIVDDRLFLPYVLAAYLETTQDWAILEEPVAYLEDRPIPEGQRDLYGDMAPGSLAEPLYAHCRRAIDSALRFGPHGLPLMAGGDWNDGMDLVGQGGGESVWLGWFLLDVLRRFAPVARRFGQEADAARYEAAAAPLAGALEGAWDGAWYKRAYFGDGKPLGSAGNDACQIDCVSQAWAAIAGGKRAAEAMGSLERLLADEQNGVVRLLSPAFKGPLEQGNPVGYITSYLPGVRENGGQYTHGAAWAVLGFCALGQPEKALRLFELINPLEHARTRSGALRYMTEPYAVAGDVYAPPNGGRGGWSWYTGAAAWLYKIGLEDMLGIRRQGQELVLAPCVPFDGFQVRYRFGGAVYELNFIRGEKKGPRRVALLDDGKAHRLDIIY